MYCRNLSELTDNGSQLLFWILAPYSYSALLCCSTSFLNDIPIPNVVLACQLLFAGKFYFRFTRFYLYKTKLTKLCIINIINVKFYFSFTRFYLHYPDMAIRIRTRYADAFPE